MNVNFAFLRIASSVVVLGIAGGLIACTTDPNDPGAMAGSGGMAGTPMGTGGAAGAVGAGGMAPAGTACASAVSIAAATPTIADFDTYDGRDLGTWSFPLGGDSASGVLAGTFRYGDRADGFPETFEMTAGQNSMYALRVADTLAQNYGGGMGTWLSTCVNATKFTGISFWVKGNAPKVSLKMPMQETLPSTPANAGEKIGTCAGTIADKTCVHPIFTFPVTNTWTKIEAPWTSVTPGNAAGTAVMPDGRNITQFEFAIELMWVADITGAVVPTPAPYDVTVDSMTFY
ncbi:MAG TPA: hypothetical protein VFH68_25025 [Polyangia bacterium]|nr:hypothetical protein [Polyangia bacterium]